jgi:hypothetical protein
MPVGKFIQGEKVKKGLSAGLLVILSILMFTVSAFADWKETDRDRWRIIYIDDEIFPVGQGTFVLREKKEYISEGPRCSCTPQEVIISYAVDSADCTVQSYEMKALDEDGNVISAQRGGEAIPEISLAPYCKIAQVNVARIAEINRSAMNAQLASVSRDSESTEPTRP